MASITARSLRFSRPLITFYRPTTSSLLQSRFASSDYGSPTGGPISTNPKEQGPNPSADKEHPGPPPPKVGQDTGTGGTKKGAGGHNTPNSQSDVRPSVGNAPTQPSGSKKFSTSARAWQQEVQAKKGTEGAQPKILSESPPTDDKAPEDVKRHNEEFAKRGDRSAERVRDEDLDKDKVAKGFWKGDVGKKGEGSH